MSTDRQSDNPAIAEHAHHKDECRTNNHPDNIEVLAKSEHHSLHSKRLAQQGPSSKIPEERVVEALAATGSVKGAARVLGLTHMTIRNRWPHLIAHLKRKSPIEIDDPAILAKVRDMAEDPRYSIYDVAKKIGCDPKTVSRLCSRHNFPWVSPSAKGRPHKMPTFERLEADGIIPGTENLELRPKGRKPQPKRRRPRAAAQHELPFWDRRALRQDRQDSDQR